MGMEYVPLIYSNPDAWDGMSAAEQAAAYGAM